MRPALGLSWVSTYSAHQETPCPRCRGKLRLWPLTSPLAKFRCSAELGACVTSSTGSKIKSNGRNRSVAECDSNVYLHRHLQVLLLPV